MWNYASQGKFQRNCPANGKVVNLDSLDKVYRVNNEICKSVKLATVQKRSLAVWKEILWKRKTDLFLPHCEFSVDILDLEMLEEGIHATLTWSQYLCMCTCFILSLSLSLIKKKILLRKKGYLLNSSVSQNSSFGGPGIILVGDV